MVQYEHNAPEAGDIGHIRRELQEMEPLLTKSYDKYQRKYALRHTCLSPNPPKDGV